ncbi:MAG: quinohemoprotein amine dehydrogenase subunit alpha [Oceanospirillaceae bacterium]|nr:quinohemoprotein amine dehydrogenase subunit alpha [Oceanospirillaceae bacterium]MBT10630.1 quinohemoprotein amine dehydrogenase subunit alpha [Oceanospirillaceae bacterium]
MNNKLLKPLGLGLLTALSVASQSAVAEGDAVSIINDKCVACHAKESDTSWSRISHMRKTPEGWLGTIGRMQVMHGLEISSEERATVMKYLADTQGLAPSETEGYRYALEQRMNTHEEFESGLFTEMCARCHSGARVKLQHRPESEWMHLANFHIGQYPTIEYHALARDRDWWPIVKEQMVPMLGKQQPLESTAWSEWLKAGDEAVVGSWSVAGHMPAKGDLHAVMTVTEKEGDDMYAVALEGAFADGTPLTGEGSAIVYTGYEWRASIKVGDETMRQVFAVQDGTMTGRMYSADDDSRGMDITAAVESGKARVLAVQPAYIKAGTETELTIVGANLSGEPSLGKGVAVVKVLKSSDNLIKVLAKAGKAEGVNTVAVGTTSGAELAVYSSVAAVKVVPEFAVARVGGNGGSTAPVEARFDAEAWAAGKDGKAGTDDDFRIGFMPASWTAKAFDEQAAADEDLKYAGTLSDNGVFSPAGAGPNPDRKMSTNNAGHLTVVGTVTDGDSSVEAEAELIVTVQRWNTPPIP